MFAMVAPGAQVNFVGPGGVAGLAARAQYWNQIIYKADYTAGDGVALDAYTADYSAFPEAWTVWPGAFYNVIYDNKLTAYEANKFYISLVDTGESSLAVEFDFTPGNLGTIFSVMFAIQDIGYLYEMGAGYVPGVGGRMIIVEKNNFVNTFLQDDQGQDMTPGVTYRYYLNWSGSHAEIFRDGYFLETDQILKYSGTRIGLEAYTYPGSQAQAATVDNFRVFKHV